MLQNTGATAINGWRLTWTASNDVTLSNSWGATVTASGRNFAATPAAWNGTVAPNASIDFGMQLGYSGAKPLPVNLTWEGLNCTVVVK